MKIFKVHQLSSSPVYDNDRKVLILVNDSYHGSETARLDKYFGKCTLSFKFKKQRKLVKGEIKCNWTHSPEALWIEWVFVPRNVEKLKSILEL